jgi:hypothetical protein
MRHRVHFPFHLCSADIDRPSDSNDFTLQKKWSMVSRCIDKNFLFCEEACDKTAFHVKEKMTMAVSASNKMRVQRKKWNTGYFVSQASFYIIGS